jgi:hypothetical protein
MYPWVNTVYVSNPNEEARMDGFYEGMEWTLDNILWWVFLAGIASGLVFSFGLMAIIVWVM